jgi:hypothetical protein
VWADGCQPIVDTIVDLNAIAAVHRYMEGNRARQGGHAA